MIQLVPMQEDEFQVYLGKSIQDYAQDKVKAGNWHPTEALQKSEVEFQQLLPHGVTSPNQYLFSIVEAELGKVGIIWFAIEDEQPQPRAFIYDFAIDEAYRRQGYGAQALLAIEEKIRALGIDTIGLHVFGYNTGALALYQKMGYQITNISMAKSIGDKAMEKQGLSAK